MGDADSEAITVETDGITVRKTVDTEQFQTLAVVIELATTLEEVARVQLLDRIPADVPMDDVGFHPEYGAEHWSVEDGTVAFERDLEPGESYTTIYGIRGFPKDEIDDLLVDPEIGLVDTGPDRLEEVVDGNRSEAVREFLSGDAELPGLEVDSPADAVAEPAHAAEPEPAVDPNVETPADGATAEPASPAATDRREVSVPLTGGVVRVLIKELRDGNVDPDDRRMLRDELLDTEGSTEARVAHLQQRVSDLEAYTDALEAFIDEEGTGAEILSDLRDDVGRIGREMNDVDDRLDETLDAVTAVEDQLDEVDMDLGTIESRSELLSDRLEDLEDDIAGVDRRVGDLGADLNQLSGDVDTVDERVGGVDDRVTSLDDRLDELGDAARSDRRELREDIEALAADLDDFETFRDRLSSVFGGSGGPGEPFDEPADTE